MAPSISNGVVAFLGTGINGQVGIYLVPIASPDPIVRVADLTTAIPGGISHFTSFARFPAIDGQDVLQFMGSGLPNPT